MRQTCPISNMSKAVASWIMLLAAFLAGLASAHAGELPKLALLPFGDKSAGAIAALMEAELSKRDDVVVLDRANVARILAEHAIRLEGGFTADDAIAASRLLTCSIFAEIYSEQGKPGVPPVCSLVAFDSVTGVRLCDSAIGVPQDIEKAAREGVALLAMAVRKLPGEGTRPAVRGVTLRGVRNVDLPLEQSGVAACLGGMIERRLLRAPGVTVLERKRLDQVNRESALTADTRARLLASMVLLDLDLYRGKKAGSVRIRGSIGNAAGKELGTVEFEGDYSDVQGMVDGVSRLILETLDMPAGTVAGGGGRQESDRFSEEFQRFFVRGCFAEALVAAEAVVALDPGNLDKQANLCCALESVAYGAAASNRTAEVLDMVERDLAIREGWIGRKYCPELKTSPTWRFDDMVRSVMLNRDKLKPEDQSRLVPLCEAARRWCRYESPRRPPWQRMRYIDLCAQNADEWLDALFQTGQPLLDMRGYRQNGKGALYGIGDLSAKGVARVMDYYKVEAEKGNAAIGTSAIDAAICRVLFPRYYPNSFTNADELVRSNLAELVDLVISHGKDSGPLFYFALRYNELQLNPDIIIPELKRLMAATYKNKIVEPRLAIDLAILEKNTSSDPGAHMVDACRRLLDPEYSLRTNRYGSARCEPQTKAEVVKYIEDLYLRLYKKPMDLDTVSLVSQDKQGKVPSWKTEEKVFSLPKGRTTISSFELAGDAGYLVLKRAGGTGQGDPAGYSLLKVGLDGHKVEKIQEVNTGKSFDGKLHVGKKSAYLPGVDGFIIMPLDGSAPSVVERGKDLVDAQVDSIVELDDTVYLGCCRTQRVGNDQSWSILRVEGHLLRCDLKGKNIQVVASSARSQKSSPLDNTDPYQIQGFFHDKPRQRLLFVADGAWEAASAGWYALSLQTSRITRVFDRSGNWRSGIRAWGDDNCLVGDGYFGGSVYVWECANDKIVPLVCDWGDHIKDLVTYTYDMTRCDMGPVYHQSHACIETVEVLGDMLYTAAPHNKGFPVVLKWATRETCCEKATAIPPLDKTAPIVLRKWKGRLVACTEDELWLLEPAGASSP